MSTPSCQFNSQFTGFTLSSSNDKSKEILNQIQYELVMKVSTRFHLMPLDGCCHQMGVFIRHHRGQDVRTCSNFKSPMITCHREIFFNATVEKNRLK